MITMIVEAAGRSFLLLAALLVILHLLRIRSDSAQIGTIRIGLLAALLMPFLMQLRVVSIPVDTGATTALFAATAQVESVSQNSLLTVVTVTYALISIALLLRLAAGLIAAWRLHRNAELLCLPAIGAQTVRVSSSVSVPVTVGTTILLPKDHSTWSARKLSAALLHEGAHASSGDFYWHVAALLHRAVFWINPLAWWLPKRMAELAEMRCDRIAVGAIGDAIDYARVLLEFARKPAPNALTVAMARSADVKRRVDHLLSKDAQIQPPSRRKGVMVSTTAIAIAALIASASCKPVKPEEVVVIPKFSAERPLTKPPYDAAARRAGHEGTVFVSILVDVDGRVADVKMQKSSGHDALDTAVLNEARANWWLQPGTVNGKPKQMWVTVPIVFKLTPKDAEPSA